MTTVPAILNSDTGADTGAGRGDIVDATIAVLLFHADAIHDAETSPAVSRDFLMRGRLQKQRAILLDAVDVLRARS